MINKTGQIITKENSNETINKMKIYGLYNAWSFAVGEFSACLQPCPPLRAVIKMTHGSNREVEDSHNSHSLFRLSGGANWSGWLLQNHGESLS